MRKSLVVLSCGVVAVVLSFVSGRASNYGEIGALEAQIKQVDAALATAIDDALVNWRVSMDAAVMASNEADPAYKNDMSRCVAYDARRSDLEQLLDLVAQSGRPEPIGALAAFATYPTYGFQLVEQLEEARDHRGGPVIIVHRHSGLYAGYSVLSHSEVSEEAVAAASRKHEAIRRVLERRMSSDALDEGELEAAFRAVFPRAPDKDDYIAGLWSRLDYAIGQD